MAYTYAFTKDSGDSTIRRSDGAEFPQDPGNADYMAWQQFTAGGGSTTAATVATLENRRDVAKGIANAMASDAIAVATFSVVRDDMAGALRFREAQDYEAAITPNDADYPMLAGEVPANGATVDAVHDAVLAEGLALRTVLGAIEAIRRTAFADIGAAADQAELDAILAALDYTP
jgi:hypothetical protein